MKKVIISIISTQGVDDGEPEKLELETDGLYSYDEDKATLRYMESELTGLEGTETTFEAGPEGVTLTRTGTVETQMIFSEGEKYYFIYETGYGSLTMGVDTQCILAELNDKGGRLEIKYMIDMENAVISRNSFIINIREA